MSDGAPSSRRPPAVRSRESACSPGWRAPCRRRRASVPAALGSRRTGRIRSNLTGVSSFVRTDGRGLSRSGRSVVEDHDREAVVGVVGRLDDVHVEDVQLGVDPRPLGQALTQSISLFCPRRRKHLHSTQRTGRGHQPILVRQRLHENRRFVGARLGPFVDDRTVGK